MAQEIRDVVFNIQVRTEDGAVKIEGLTKGFVKAESAFKKMQATLAETNEALKGSQISTGLANTAILEFGRTVSDAPYGIQGMGNNISQLVSILGQMSQSAKEGGSVLGSLRDAFIGPLGVVVAVQVAVAAYEMYERSQRQAEKAAKDLEKSIEDQNKTLNEQAVLLNMLSETAFDYGNDFISILSKNSKEVGKFLEEIRKEGPVTREVFDAAIEKGKELIEARKDINKSQKELLDLDEKIRQERERDFVRDSVLKQLLIDEKDARNDLVVALDAEAAALKFLNYEATEEVELVGKTAEKLKEEKLAVESLGTTYQRTAEFKKMMADIGFDFTPPPEALKKAAEEAVKEFQKFVDQTASAREGTENDWYLKTLGLTKENFESALSAASELTGIINGVFQSEADRSIDIEKSKTNALNDQLKERLANEQLSAQERDKINQQISRNESNLVKRENEINKKRFQQEKAFSIAQATINTYLAASDVLAREKGGLAAKIIGMTVVIASGLAQVSAIARQQFVGQALPTPNLVAQGGGPADSQGPAFNIVGAGGQSQLAQAIAAQQRDPVRAYVVAGEVTTAQSLERNKIQEASI